MSGGGGTTTNTTNVAGLADSQYADISGGQSAIRGDMSSFANQQAGVDARLSGAMDTGFNNVNTNLNNVGSKVGDVNNNVTTGFNNVGTQLGALSSSVGTRLDGMGSNMATGFAGMNTALKDTSNELKSGMNNGFVGLSNQADENAKYILGTTVENFDDTNANIAKGFADNTGNVNTRLDAQGNQIGTGFDRTNTNIDAFRSSALSGQNDIRGLVEKYGGNLDRYYADLAAAGRDQTGRIGDIQTDIGTFRNDFQKSDQLANQQRARMADQVVGGFNAVRENIRNSQGLAATQAANLSNQVSGVQSAVEGTPAQISTDFARVAKEITVGFSNGSQQQQQAQTEFASNLNSIRSLVNDGSIQVEESVRQQYRELSDSFDDSGKLIQRSVDQQGLTTARAIDNQGRLLLASFDTGGSRVGQQSLDINRMMQTLSSSGLLSGPAPQSNGLMNPYATSVG